MVLAVTNRWTLVAVEPEPQPHMELVCIQCKPRIYALTNESPRGKTNNVVSEQV